jgi:DNA-binding transcriptional ArsR family regulator
VQPGEENILDAARVDNSLVDLSKLTKRDFEEDEPVVGEYNGPSATDPACYKFDSAQSVTTIQHNTDKLKASSAGKSVASLNMGESIFTLNQDDDDDDDADGADAGALAATSDPLTSLRDEEMQFDLSFLKTQQPMDNGEESIGNSGQSSSKESKAASSNELEVEVQSTAKVLATQFDEATSDAGLVAAAIGLDLSSVAQEDIKDEDCFAIVLAGIDSARSFEEMFEILESLIEEAEESDSEVLRHLREMNTHIPQRLRELLVVEARESGESALDHLNKLHGWLRESEVEAADEEAAIDRYHERQYFQDGTLQPRPEEYGDEEPQGCEHRETMPRTNESAQTASATDDLTSRLGAHTK